jgi:hypothetical protein
MIAAQEENCEKTKKGFYIHCFIHPKRENGERET